MSFNLQAMVLLIKLYDALLTIVKTLKLTFVCNSKAAGTFMHRYSSWVIWYSTSCFFIETVSSPSSCWGTLDVWILELGKYRSTKGNLLILHVLLSVSCNSYGNVWDVALEIISKLWTYHVMWDLRFVSDYLMLISHSRSTWYCEWVVFPALAVRGKTWSNFNVQEGLSPQQFSFFTLCVLSRATC